MFEHVDDLKSQTGDGTGDEQTLLQRCSADDSLEHDGGGDCAAEREEKPGGRGGKWWLFNHRGGSEVGGVVLNRTGDREFEGSFASLARGMRTRVR